MRLDGFPRKVFALGGADFRKIGPQTKHLADFGRPGVAEFLVDDASDPPAGGETSLLDGSFELGFGLGVEVDGDLGHGSRIRPHIRKRDSAARVGHTFERDGAVSRGANRS